MLWNVCDAPPVNVSWWLADSDQEDHSHNSGRLNIRKPIGKYLSFSLSTSTKLYHFTPVFVCTLGVCNVALLIEIIPKHFTSVDHRRDHLGSIFSLLVFVIDLAKIKLYIHIRIHIYI